MDAVSNGETENDSCQGELMSSDNVQDESEGNLGCVSCAVEDGHDMEMNSNVGSNDVESSSESESESESETSSSWGSLSSASSSSFPSSSASSASSESEDDGEEGEIMNTALKKTVSWSEKDDDEDDEADLPNGPIRSKNELQVLPLVPHVTASLQPSHQIFPVGVISSVMGTQVIVEGSEKHNPLSEGSILWLTKKRLALGIIDEIFGPVKTPYYIVRYNSESDVPADTQNGTAIGFVPEFVGHVLNDKNLYQKGYDASGNNDEEVRDETEFSDDEKEAKYRKILKTSKNVKGKEKICTNKQASASQCPTVGPSQSTNMQQQFRPPSDTSTIRPVFTGGPYLHQNMAMFSGFQLNTMPWLQQIPSTTLAMWQQQQFLLQLLYGNLRPPQQQFNLCQLMTGGNNFNAGTSNSPWPCMLGPNVHSPMFPGFVPNRPQPVRPSENSQPGTSFPANGETSTQTRQGVSSGRGRGRTSFQRRGGRFGR